MENGKNVKLKLSLIDDSILQGEISYSGLLGEYYIVLSKFFTILNISAIDNNGEERDVTFKKIEQFKKNYTPTIIYELGEKADNLKINFVCSKNFSKHKHYADCNKNYINFDKNHGCFYPFVFQGDPTSLRKNIMQMFLNKNTIYSPMEYEGFDEYEVISGQDGTLPLSPIDPYSFHAIRKDKVNKLAFGQTIIYTRLEKELMYAERVARDSDEILQWYNKFLFSKRKMNNVLNIVSVSNKYFFSAYFRGKVIIYDNFLKLKDIFVYRYVAHEMAHNWGLVDENVENVNEHMLEEGVAEWCALVFRYYKRNETFDKQLLKVRDIFLKYYKKDMKAKAKFYSTHAKGFFMFYDIFQSYGITKVVQCLRYFVYAQSQSAEGMLAEVKQRETPEFIEYFKMILEDALKLNTEKRHRSFKPNYVRNQTWIGNTIPPDDRPEISYMTFDKAITENVNKRKRN